MDLWIVCNACAVAFRVMAATGPARCPDCLDRPALVLPPRTAPIEVDA